MSAAWVAAFATLSLVTLLNTAVVLGGLRRIASVLERAEAQEPAFGAAVGSAVHPFDLLDEEGMSVPWRELVREPTMLLLVSTDCAACAALAEQLEDAGDEVEGVPLVLVVEGSPEASRAWLPSGPRTLYQRDGAATRALGNRATPQAYVVDPSGVVLGRRVPATLDDLRDMARLQRDGRARTPEAMAYR